MSKEKDRISSVKEKKRSEGYEQTKGMRIKRRRKERTRWNLRYTVLVVFPAPTTAQGTGGGRMTKSGWVSR